MINLTKILGSPEKTQDVLSEISKNSQNGESFEKILQKIVQELSKSNAENNHPNDSSTQKFTSGLLKEDVKKPEESLKNVDGQSERKVKETTAGDGIEKGNNVKEELKEAEIEKDNFKLLNKTQLMTEYEMDKTVDRIKQAKATVKVTDDIKENSSTYGDTGVAEIGNAEIIRDTEENNDFLVLNKEKTETASKLKEKFIEEFSPKVPKESEKTITVVDASAKIQINNRNENAVVHDSTQSSSQTNFQKSSSVEHDVVEQLPNKKMYNEWRISSQSQVSQSLQDVKLYQVQQSKQLERVAQSSTEVKDNLDSGLSNISKNNNNTLNFCQALKVEDKAGLQNDLSKSVGRFIDNRVEEREKREFGISNKVITIVTSNKDNLKTDLSDRPQVLQTLAVEISRIIQKQQVVSVSLSNTNHMSSGKNNSSQAVFVINSGIPISDSPKNVVSIRQNTPSFYQVVQTQPEQKKGFDKGIDENILQVINSIKIITSEQLQTILGLENKNAKAPVVETANSADPKLSNGQMIFTAELVKNIATEKPKINYNKTMENIENTNSENPLKAENKTTLPNMFQSEIKKDVVEQVHSDWQDDSRNTESLSKEKYNTQEFRNEVGQAPKNKLEIKSLEIEYKMKEDTKKEEFQERPNISNKFLERLAELTYKSSESKTDQTYQTNSRFELVERLQHSQNLEEIYKKIRDFGFSNRLEENVRMKLYPEQLGNIDVQLRKEGRAITIVFVAENEKSKELLEKNIGILRDRLTALDFDVRNMEVKMKEESNYYEDARHHQNQQNQKHGEQNHENRTKAFSEEVMEDDNERERNG
ncbi:flagellar hook-length control protein FliK [Fervidobacterium pennivorans subsp. carthaginiensis]|uniref:flagellar hook-length control protein FliK n=1 Tax=Fervidobacterium pennivorans TaxID=93466 RepID=UPI00201B6F35|nr:flagellar hook-length control protein FliK [Fervidobacterium pennivorans]